MKGSGMIPHMPKHRQQRQYISIQNHHGTPNDISVVVVVVVAEVVGIGSLVVEVGRRRVVASHMLGAGRRRVAVHKLVVEYIGLVEHHRLVVGHHRPVVGHLEDRLREVVLRYRCDARRQ